MKKDSFQWLEDIHGDAVDTWVNEENKITVDRLKSDERFNGLKEKFESELESIGELHHFHRPNIMINSGFLYEIWQNPSNPRGVLRRIHLSDLGRQNIRWESLLDIDCLAESEGEDWYIYSLQTCRFSPSGKRLLVSLSESGSDAITLQELDLDRGQFVEGFKLPLKIQSASWLTEDSLVVSSPLTDEEKTGSDRSGVVRLWRRGERYDQAQVIFNAPKKYTMCNSVRIDTDAGSWVFIIAALSLTEMELYHVDEGGRLIRLDLPKSILNWNTCINGHLVAVEDQLIFNLNEKSYIEDKVYSTKSIMALNLRLAIENQGSIKNAVSEVYRLKDNEAISPFAGTSSSSKKLFLSVMRDVNSQLLVFENRGCEEKFWHYEEVDIGAHGQISLPVVCSCANITLMLFENILTAPTLYSVDENLKVSCIRTSPSKLFSDTIVTNQKFATAKDGTNIPYFLTKDNSVVHDGMTPTLVYAYGHFGSPMLQTYDYFYFGCTIRHWLRMGGALIVVNGRGGGEYGCEWHQAAKQLKKQTTFDDIYTVVQAVIDSGLTSPKKLGFIGGSGGGLTSAVTFVQRHDLFNATIAVAGRLDVLSCHRLGQGEYTTSEYGNPDNPQDAKLISSYSPFELVGNLKARYEPFFMGGTLDDRVHPGHTRKVVAKMHSVGQKALFYEAREGGHLLAANNMDKAFNCVLQTIYLMQRLID